MDILAHNRDAWNQEVAKGDIWTRPVKPEEVANARQGALKLLLSPTRPVPASWFPELKNKKVLCLASGGGQQGPLLAAAGAALLAGFYEDDSGGDLLDPYIKAFIATKAVKP